MPRRFKTRLSPEQRTELEACRDHDPKAHMREKAAAMLKIAEGHSGHEVAEQLLLKRRHEETVYRWWHRYQASGLSGLRVRQGRGRKPSFSP